MKTPQPILKPSKLKRRTQEFAKLLLEDKTMSATEAYIQTHETNNRKAASVESTKLLAKPSVLIYMQEHDSQAQKRIVELMKQDDDKGVAYRAASDVLDRLHGKARQQVEVTSREVIISIDLGKFNLAD